MGSSISIRTRRLPLRLVSRWSRFRLRAVLSRAPIPLALVLAIGTQSPARAQGPSRSLATLEQETFLQPPPLRLEAMGGLTLAVRDEHSEINLWDFMGIPIGLLYDRDSTSLDFWADQDRLALDRKRAGIEEQFDRRGNLALGGEGVIRSGKKLAVGADLGYVRVRHGLPYADGIHRTDAVNRPVIAPLATGNFGEHLAWGLRGEFGRESLDRNWWLDRLQGGKVQLDAAGQQVNPPYFFAPDQAHVGVTGIGASFGYRHLRWGEAAAYLDYRHESLEWRQEGTRHLYETSEPRDVTDFGAAAAVRPRARVEVGAAVGRELFSSVEDYRFTLSGGSNAAAATARGKRLLRNVRREFFRARAQADLDPMVPVTVGAAFRVAYDRTNQNAARTSPDDFNSFVLGRASEDTLFAPPLVEDQRQAVRTIELGGGASTRLLEERVTLGGEWRWFKDAIDGTDQYRRAQGWEVRGGGEVLVTKKWAALAGFRHRREDQDVFTPRNENKVERVTVGVRHAGFRDWAIQAYGFREWWRTEYPDPQEAGGSGMGLGLIASRLF